MNLENPRLYHFTHIDNIPTIIQNGLIADTFLESQDYINSGNLEIKNRRKTKIIQGDITVGACVPFYFAPRSPMLYTQHINNRINQKDIVYLVCYVDTIIANNYTWFCSDINAASGQANFISDPRQITNHIDTDVMDLLYWNNTETDNNKQERRMAEFLVYHKVFFRDIVGFVVYNEAHKNKLREDFHIEKTILVKPQYYF